ncbi:hypothetical protein E4U42_005916 [Claviceps africana]|uniref:2-dehydropantoate 2-reductase n=1 Tax=Claviceps africana TaxID=83212 RepID=A0A8K0J5Y0_9HYPO|nr:hypothetical protein E4U42_005916 [Claviceps africana]
MTQQPPRSPWLDPSQVEPPAKKTLPAPSFYVPSIVVPRDAAAQSPTVHKIHILGEDERSRFIAHALSSVYDSVELLGWKSESPYSKYCNIQKSRPPSIRSSPNIALNSAGQRTLAQSDSSRIDKLIVTGHGNEAVVALDAVKHRIDKDTTVCLMNDGLGVLEDVRKKIFQGTDDAEPNFLLGHMTHRLTFNRRYDSVTRLKRGQMKLTYAESPRMRTVSMQKMESRPNLVRALARAQDLEFSFSPFDEWLRFKLPSVLFDSIVEPVCVLLEIPYQGILQNVSAQRMMHGLLSEIIHVLEVAPELRESTAIRDYVYSKGIRTFMYNRIKAKHARPCKLHQIIQKGLPTGVEYLNGYFIRRGQKLGLDMRMNLMMRDMIRVKHSMAKERLNSFVPLEETSIPSDLGLRYRKSPY